MYLILCFSVLSIAQSSLNSQILVLPHTLCPDFWHYLPQLICSSRARARLRAHYLTFLLRISFSKVLVVYHSIIFACQTALVTDDCLWGLQEETEKKCKLSELFCNKDYHCFCVPWELFENGRRTQMVFQGITVHKHSWGGTCRCIICFIASICSCHKM